MGEGGKLVVVLGEHGLDALPDEIGYVVEELHLVASRRQGRRPAVALPVDDGGTACEEGIFF